MYQEIVGIIDLGGIDMRPLNNDSVSGANNSNATNNQANGQNVSISISKLASMMASSFSLITSSSLFTDAVEMFVTGAEPSSIMATTLTFAAIAIASVFAIMQLESNASKWEKRVNIAVAVCAFLTLVLLFGYLKLNSMTFLVGTRWYDLYILVKRIIKWSLLATVLADIGAAIGDFIYQVLHLR